MTGVAIVYNGTASDLPLPDESVDLIVTSPPYWGLRAYADEDGELQGQIGAEMDPGAYITNLLKCTIEWTRVLKPTGSIWVNLGDKYGRRGGVDRKLRGHAAGDGFGGRAAPRSPQRVPEGVPEKSLIGLPWRYAIKCIDDLGLILRADVIWGKANGMPESVLDRVRRSHENWFHFVKTPNYFSAIDEIREPYAPETAARYALGYNPRAVDDERPSVNTKLGGDTYQQNALGKIPGSVWVLPSQPLMVPKELNVAHFAAFPMELPRRFILGWSPFAICTRCGSGRRPVVHRDKVDDRPHRVQGRERDALLGGHRQDGRAGMSITDYTCDCPNTNADTEPAVVLDPFGGTGTTALVARAHGRVGISVDLSAAYCRLAEWRVNDPKQLRRAALALEQKR